MSKGLRPQAGFQEAFLSSAADIVIGGGAAGAGKSAALLMEPIRHVHVSGFRAVIFRKTTPQIKAPGGLFDKSIEFYGSLRSGNAIPRYSQIPPKWRFPSGATVEFSHLEHESNKHGWDGSEICFLGFDELIHFTESSFWYLIGRNRSTCGVRPYVRATTNPETHGWVKRLISWWLYPDDHGQIHLRGMPIPERAGVVRWLARYNEAQYWGDSPAEVIQLLPSEIQREYRPEFIKSVTFIPGTLRENVALMAADPAYQGNLLALDTSNASRLLEGRWYDVKKESTLFDGRDLGDMFTSEFVKTGQRYISADIAMSGSDSFTLAVWNGLRCERLWSWEKSDGRQIVDEIKAKAKEYAVPYRNIVFDCNGVGNFLQHGFLPGAFDFRGQYVPIKESGMKLDFKDLRTQCIWKLADAVREHKIFVHVGDDFGLKAMVFQEFEAHVRTGLTELGKIKVSTKNEVKTVLKRSPDYFDAILMRFVFEINSGGSYLLDDESEILFA